MTVWRDEAAAVWQPRARLTVSKWADRYRVIPQGTSPEPGPWRTERVPFLRAIMDAVLDPAIETVVVMMGSQLGKTEGLLNILAFFVAQDPSPILMVQPTVEVMTAFSRERIDTTFRASPALADKLDSGLGDRGNSRKASNTIRVKQFPGGSLALTGANAPAGLASRPIRIVLCDEIDRYPASAGTEGDPVKLARQRTSNFHNRKIVLTSTPTISGSSAIERWYEQGDQRQYLVPCPLCGARQVLRYEGLRYQDPAGELDLDHVRYQCEACEQLVDERHKLAMVAAGEWRAQKPGGNIASFGGLEAVCSPWVRWRTLVEERLRAEQDRDTRALQTFHNLRLGRPWVATEHAVGVEELERRREAYGPELPAGVLLLTAGVDVQDSRLEVEIVGWGAGRESWGVAYEVLPGRPELGAKVWRDLDQVLAQVRTTADGRRLGLTCVAVDTGGHHTTEAYAYCRAREGRGVWAVKGRGGADLPLVGKPSRVGREKVVLFTLGVDSIKGAVVDRLAIPEAGPGYCHLPRQLGYGPRWFEGILSERRLKVYRMGKERMEWVQVARRNEALDCRVYATAALEILAPDLDRLARQTQHRGAAPARTAQPPRRGHVGARMLGRGVRL